MRSCEMPKIFPHVPHPHIEQRKAQHPPSSVADQHPKDGPHHPVQQILALKVTRRRLDVVRVSIRGHRRSEPAGGYRGRARYRLISWIAQTFLQLVLLSIIIVGQNLRRRRRTRPRRPTRRRSRVARGAGDPGAHGGPGRGDREDPGRPSRGCDRLDRYYGHRRRFVTTGRRARRSGHLLESQRVATGCGSVRGRTLRLTRCEARLSASSVASGRLRRGKSGRQELRRAR